MDEMIAQGSFAGLPAVPTVTPLDHVKPEEDTSPTSAPQPRSLFAQFVGGKAETPSEKEPPAALSSFGGESVCHGSRSALQPIPETANESSTFVNQDMSMLSGREERVGALEELKEACEEEEGIAPLARLAAQEDRPFALVDAEGSPTKKVRETLAEAKPKDAQSAKSGGSLNTDLSARYGARYKAILVNDEEE